jgi:PAS domain S-box-containing protein
MSKYSRSLSAINSELPEKSETGLHVDPLTSAPIETTEVVSSRLFHELQVHQIELELQNEQLIEARNAAEQAATSFAELYDFAPVGYVTLNRTGYITRSNLAASQLLGMDCKQLEGKRLAAFVAQTSLPKYNSLFSRSNIQSRQSSLEIMIEGLVSNTVKMDISVNNNDNDLEYRMLLTDISELKQANNALKISEQYLNKAQAVTQIGSWEWDVITDHLKWSDEQYRIMGLEPKEINPTHDYFMNAIHKGDRDLILEAIKKALAGECDYDVDFRINGENGVQRTVNAKATIDRDSDDNPLRMIGINHDITEKKQLEQERNDANQEKEKRSDELKKILLELEQRVRERTIDLQKSHEQLLHAEKMSSIGRLSASIAHEFNNPLQGVTSIIQGVKKRAVMDLEDAELMSLAVKECHRMRDLIKSLQDFNRPTASIKAPVDIHATVESILMLSKKEYATRKILITKKYAINLPQVMAVSDQLKQVLLNLLSNASDACIDGGDISIETTSFEDNVVIRIHDTGCGISPDDKEHIFEPFFTNNAEMKGTGLGLSISYGIIKKHGGEIVVASEQGKGTTFSVVLPIKGVSDEET